MNRFQIVRNRNRLKAVTTIIKNPYLDVNLLKENIINMIDDFAQSLVLNSNISSISNEYLTFDVDRFSNLQVANSIRQFLHLVKESNERLPIVWEIKKIFGEQNRNIPDSIVTTPIKFDIDKFVQMTHTKLIDYISGDRARAYDVSLQNFFTEDKLYDRNVNDIILSYFTFDQEFQHLEDFFSYVNEYMFDVIYKYFETIPNYHPDINYYNERGLQENYYIQWSFFVDE